MLLSMSGVSANEFITKNNPFLGNDVCYVLFSVIFSMFHKYQFNILGGF